MMNSKLLTVAVLTVSLIGHVENVRATAIRVNLRTTDWLTPDIFTENSEDLALDSLAMLFWTASQNFDGFNNINPAAPTGGDILLDALPTHGSGAPALGNITNPAYASKSYSSADFGVDLPSGYVYVVAFNLAHTTYESVGVPVGTYYALTPSTPFDVVNSPDATFPADHVGAAISAQGPYTMTANTIPEPGTMALFVIGSVAFLGLRRRFKRS